MLDEDTEMRRSMENWIPWNRGRKAKGAMREEKSWREKEGCKWP